MNDTDLFLFESAFARDTYQRTIGTPKGLVRCVFNGVTANEFDPIVKADDATDLVYVGEFRHIKGADLLIDAVARLRADGRPVTLTLAGDGEESASLKAQVQRLGLGEAVRFIGHVKARLRLLQGLAAGGSVARRFHALCRDRGRRGRHSDDRRQCRRHPRDFRPPWRCLVRAQQSPSAMADAIETALEDPAAALRAGQIAARADLPCISRRRRWSRASLPATATRLPIVNRSLPT